MKQKTYFFLSQQTVQSIAGPVPHPPPFITSFLVCHGQENHHTRGVTVASPSRIVSLSLHTSVRSPTDILQIIHTDHELDLSRQIYLFRTLHDLYDL